MKRAFVFFPMASLMMLAACSGSIASKQPSPEVIATKSSGEVVEFEGEYFVVGVSPDRTFAFVGKGDDTSMLKRRQSSIRFSPKLAKPENTNLSEMVLVAAKTTNCYAEPVDLFSFPQVRMKISDVRIFEANRDFMRVELDCSQPADLEKIALENVGGARRAKIMQRPLVFSKYPENNKTYLSYSDDHGFQVNYLAADGKGWLWYPGNNQAVEEDWKLEGDHAICFRHAANTYNPVTKQRGGEFGCQDLELTRKLTVAKLAGDPYNLSAGAVPYRRDKCDAPEEFEFDRNLYGCGK